MQAYPEWIVELEAASYGYPASVVEEILYTASGQTESCLLLDVYVPTEIFEAGSVADGKQNSILTGWRPVLTNSLAPVLFWIHGGGFTYGSKTASGDPAGLIARSKLDGSDGVIVVTINYRLGLFGWLAGEGVTSNLGMFS